MNKESLHRFIENEHSNICQIVCYKNGEEVFSDEWNDYKKTDAVHVMSVTKSIVGLLIGICIDKGFINSLDDKIIDYFPDYKVKRGEKTIYEVTIRHLMTMKAPYKCKYDPWVKVCTSDDWTVASLNLLGGRKGITDEFKYMTVPLHILSGLIETVTNMKPVDFANKYLFAPLGIVDSKCYFAKSAEEHKAFTMSKTPKKHIWFCDPRDIPTAGYGLCLSADNLARIGQLCLNKGTHNKTTLISETWMDEIKKITQICGDKYGNMNYGLLWWIIDQEKRIYAAIGNSGNVIYVNESTNFVAGVTGYFKPTVFDRIEFIQEYLDV